MSTANMQFATVEVDVGEGEALPEQHLDEGESIERVVLPLSELYERLVHYSKEGKIVDARLYHWAYGLRFCLQNQAKYQLSRDMSGA
jgi:ADP-ribose pyrophosphatase